MTVINYLFQLLSCHKCKLTSFFNQSMFHHSFLVKLQSVYRIIVYEKLFNIPFLLI